MLNFRVAVLTGVLALAASVPGRADFLAGTQVTGSITFGSNPNNYYDPANRYVPPGYLNTTYGTTVTVNPAAGVTEFGFADRYDTDTADFTDSTLTITDMVLNASAGSWTQTFTDAEFAFTKITSITSNFGNGGLTVNLNTIADTLTISWAGTGGASVNTTYQAQINMVDPQPGPNMAEPSSMMLLLAALGAAGVGARKLRRATA